MDRFEFVTDRGSIKFNIYSAYKLLSHNGVNESDIEDVTVEYPNTDGEDILNTLYKSRKVEINGYIRADNEYELIKLKRDLIRIVNGKDKGRLKYTTSGGTYFTEAKPDGFPLWGEVIQNTVKFTVYFNLYNIFWKSNHQMKKDVYTRRNNVTIPFQFPDDNSGIVFTTRNNVANILNSGDVPVEAIIRIVCTKSEAEPEISPLSIYNNTTDDFMMITHGMAKGETIVIDNHNFEITSSVHGNILHKMTGGDFFTLALGINEFEVINGDIKKSIAVTVEFYNAFLGV